MGWLEGDEEVVEGAGLGGDEGLDLAADGGWVGGGDGGDGAGG